MMSGRPKAELMLSESERGQLKALTMRRKTAQALALRARIVLACADGIDNKTVAKTQGVSQQTVSKWRVRCVDDRLEIKSNVVFGKFGLIRRQAVAEPVCCRSPVVRL